MGWRIWKTRNDLLYNNRKWSIPDIIHQALMDYRMWKEAINVPQHQLNHNHNRPSTPNTLQEVLTQIPSLYCCTDASWIDRQSNAGIGWTLHDSAGRYILKGSASIDPTDSALEAEAIALREALLHLKRLNYHNVTFCGDSFSLFGYLMKAANYRHKPLPGPLEIQHYLDDIITLAKNSCSFKFIGRKANVLADGLAKTAMLRNLPLVISWVF